MFSGFQFFYPGQRFGAAVADIGAEILTLRAHADIFLGLRSGGISNRTQGCGKVQLLTSQGKLDPAIGRENEIRRLMQVLSRRTKNNPVLIGEAGVGKTAIVEGLAQRIVRGDVPENLKCKLISLDMGALVDGWVKF